MIISDKYQFVFVHIPKNAGTSLTEFIKLIDPKAKNISGHQTANFIKSEYPQYQNYLFFCVLRHPLQRAISLYYHAKKFGPLYLSNDAKQLNFNQFMEKNCEDVHFKNKHWICDENDQILVDYIIDYDYLETEIHNFFCQITKLQQMPKFPHKNGSPYKKSDGIKKHYHDEKFRSFIDNKFANEIIFYDKYKNLKKISK